MQAFPMRIKIAKGMLLIKWTLSKTIMKEAIMIIIYL